ncbi:hypothetical protein [Stieleria sedimenti]|nr:hypothetical protein [Stieleria sedimenti]
MPIVTHSVTYGLVVTHSVTYGLIVTHSVTYVSPASSVARRTRVIPIM